MSTFLKSVFQPPQKEVSGSPGKLVRYVVEDIEMVKNEIRKYNEITGVLQANDLYLKLLKLLEQEHKQDLHDLKVKFSYNEKSATYQRQLLSIHKKVLADYSKLLELVKGHYSHEKYSSYVAKNRGSSEASSGSSISTEQICDEAPETLLDPISFNFFTDPVVTPAGISYERAYLLEHLKKRGNFDPITKQPLKESQLYPNLALKDAVCRYINERA